MSKKFLFFSLLVFLFLSFFVSGCVPKQKKVEEKREEVTPKATMEKVLMVIAPNNFRDEEYQKPKEVLENAGFQVVTSSKGVKVAKGMLGATVNVDLDLSKANVEDYVALIFVGGTGSSVYFNDQTALDLAKKAVQSNKVVGAICIAPSILVNAGTLVGKSATCYPSEAQNLKAKGANYTGQPVTVDGKIITANGPAAAKEFGEKIVEVLRN